MTSLRSLRPTARRLFVVLVFLGLFVGGGALRWSAHADTKTVQTSADTTQAAADTTAPHRVIAYYLHTKYRCASCRKIEAYTTEAIETGFAHELADGRLVFRSINVEEKGNEHFVKDFQMFTKSVILVDEWSGQQTAWKNLPKVWELLGDKTNFLRYIREETSAYLTAAQP